MPDLGPIEYIAIGLLIIFMVTRGVAQAEVIERLRRVEGKLDRLLQHNGLEYMSTDVLSDEVKAMAMDPRQRIAAIKRHREQTGAGLKETKELIDEYVRQQAAKE